MTLWLYQHRALGLLFGLLLLCAQARTLAAEANTPLTLAVHPYLPVPEIQKRFAPLADYLSRTLRRPVRIKVGGNYEEHIKVIGNDQTDLAFLGPVGYVRVTSQYGGKPLLARFQVGRQPDLHGVIAVRKDSPLEHLAELRDKRFAFGDPDSTMSHIVPRYLLMRAGIADGLPIPHQFLGSHQNVAIGILVGDFEAGAMKQEVFDEFAAKGLRALAVTPGVPDHVFVSRANLPPAQVRKLRQALLMLARQPDGMRILQRLHPHLSGLITATDAEYDALREMVKAVDAGSR